jgi:hypothetical protein
MAGQAERSRRSSRARKGTRDSDSDLDEKDFLEEQMQMDSGGGEGVHRESDRLAKIQEKNRKAQQKCAPMSAAPLRPSLCMDGL